MLILIGVSVPPHRGPARLWWDQRGPEADYPQVSQPAAEGAPVSIIENLYRNGETIRLDGAIRMAPR
jgi:hypothetical protein